MSHYIVCRQEYGWNSGPGPGTSNPDEVRVVGASRTLARARRIRRQLGAGRWIERRADPYRQYRHDEFLRYGVPPDGADLPAETL